MLIALDPRMKTADNVLDGGLIGPDDKSMSDNVENLILDLLRWLAIAERSYDEVMEAWRTSCPRFPVWEDANDRGLVTKVQIDGRLRVRITASGRALLETHKPPSRLEG